MLSLHSKYPSTQSPNARKSFILGVCQGSLYDHPKQYISHYSVEMEIPQIYLIFLHLFDPSNMAPISWSPKIFQTSVFQKGDFARSLVLPCLCPHDPEHRERNCRRSRRVYNWRLASPVKFLGVAVSSGVFWKIPFQIVEKRVFYTLV